jgi:hypothetical protein
VYLFLAFFWLVVGVLAQIYWTDLEPRAYIPVNRTIVGFLFFALFSFNYMRWRMARLRQQVLQEANEQSSRPRRADPPIGATFDSNPPDVQKKDPPVA